MGVLINSIFAGLLSLAALSVVPATPQTPVPAIAAEVQAPLVPVSETLPPAGLQQQAQSQTQNQTASEPAGPAILPVLDPKVGEYIIQPDDVIQISVYEEPDLTTHARVTGAGEIYIPLLGRLQAGGLSVLQLQAQLTEMLGKDYLVNPQVQVFIETYHARTVYVTGAVNKAGSYALPTGKVTTVMEAITMAAGFNQEAAINSVRIIRVENGAPKTIKVRAKDILKGDKSKDVEVQPNDVIVVPESFL